MVRIAAMNELFTWNHLRKKIMNAHMIRMSCTSANRAAAPDSGLKRMAM